MGLSQPKIGRKLGESGGSREKEIVVASFSSPRFTIIFLHKIVCVFICQRENVTIWDILRDGEIEVPEANLAYA